MREGFLLRVLDGTSWVSGALVARLLGSHPGFTLAFCTSDAAAGEPISARMGFASALSFVPNKDAATMALGVDAVVLATPAEVSASLAPALRRQGC